MEFNNQSPEALAYFSKEMRDEFFVNYARREARKLIKRLNIYKISSDLETHIQKKYNIKADGS